MATHREREFKLGIPDEDSFERLIRAAGGTREDPVEQVNHFFETSNWDLREQRVGLRLRRESGKFILTLKGPSSTGEGAVALAERCELEAEAPEASAEEALSGERSIVQLLPILEALPDGNRTTEGLIAAVRDIEKRAPLRHIGSFSNRRTRVHTTLDLQDTHLPATLEFDCTHFADDDIRRELELEIGDEVPVEAVHDALCALFEREGVNPIPTASKLAHFQERLMRAELSSETSGGRP